MHYECEAEAGERDQIRQNNKKLKQKKSTGFEELTNKLFEFLKDEEGKAR